MFFFHVNNYKQHISVSEKLKIHQNFRSDRTKQRAKHEALKFYHRVIHVVLIGIILDFDAQTFSAFYHCFNRHNKLSITFSAIESPITYFMMAVKRHNACFFSETHYRKYKKKKSPLVISSLFRN